MRRVAVLTSALLVAAALVACDGTEPEPSRSDGNGLMTVEVRREWAARLRADGLDDQAIEIYESILADGSGIENKTVVGTSVIIADIHIGKGRYEEALRSLYRAALFEPGGEQARRIDEKKILCFERLGRGGAADRLLDRAAGLGAKAGDATADGAVVVAEIGGETVTRADLDSIIASTTPEVRAELEADPAKRRQLLESLVAARVLERKAIKLDYDDDVGVRLAMAAASREILVRKLLAEEIREKVTVADGDAKLYYEAHRERFREPRVLEIAHVLVKDGAAEDALRARLASEDWDALAAELSRDDATARSGGRIEQPVVEGRRHPAFTSVDDVLEAVGDTPVGEVSPDSVATTAGRHVIKVLAREGGRELPFDEVAEHAAKMLRAERESAAIDAVMKQALATSDVKIHGDRL